MRLRPIMIAIALFFASGMTVACMKKRTAPSGTIKSGILPGAQTHGLLEVLKTGALKVCLAFPDEMEPAHASTRAELSAAYKANVEAAVKEWLVAATKAHSGWKLAEVQVTVRESPDCVNRAVHARGEMPPPGSDDLNEVVVLGVRSPDTVARIFNYDSGGRSFALMRSRLVLLTNKAYFGDKKSFKTMRHELGHLFGLSDTYDEILGGALPGHETSIMNKSQDEISADEIGGLHSLVEAMTADGGELKCHRDYESVRYLRGPHKTSASSLFCVRKSQLGLLDLKQSYMVVVAADGSESDVYESTEVGTGAGAKFRCVAKTDKTQSLDVEITRVDAGQIYARYSMSFVKASRNFQGEIDADRGSRGASFFVGISPEFALLASVELGERGLLKSEFDATALTTGQRSDVITEFRCRSQ
jgi:hypothetical protein